MNGSVAANLPRVRRSFVVVDLERSGRPGKVRLGAQAQKSISIGSWRPAPTVSALSQWDAQQDKVGYSPGCTPRLGLPAAWSVAWAKPPRCKTRPPKRRGCPATKLLSRGRYSAARTSCSATSRWCGRSQRDQRSGARARSEDRARRGLRPGRAGEPCDRAGTVSAPPRCATAPRRTR
jgi:hypothetical protein